MALHFLLLLTLIPFSGSFSPFSSHVSLKESAAPSSLVPLLHSESVASYRPFAEYAWDRLGQITSLEPVPIQDSYTDKQSDPIGPNKSVTSIKIRALQPSTTTTQASNIRYARYALLETNTPNAVQVLNLCIFPQRKDLPVWGADFVSLPGGKHLLLLDAQPMNNCTSYATHWKDWYETEVASKATFPWGGDLPEPVQPFVSDFALWTRLADGRDDPEAEKAKSVESILADQGPLYQAFCKHLDIYLHVVGNRSISSDTAHEQGDYIKYRLENDPARPMLQRLYGAEWTEHVLENYLFPQD